jgi:vacuolar protein sorting-associated protein 8
MPSPAEGVGVGSSRSAFTLRSLGMRDTRPLGMGSQRGVELAEAREQKFMRSGNRDVMSPLQVRLRLRLRGGRGRGPALRAWPACLQVKRRMRPKSQKSDASTASGRVRTEVVDAITKQLVKNAQYVSHGPGVPTAISIHPKFIAIGTKRGLVLLFDHYHEVRNVLGNTAEAETDGAVTSLDVSKT